MKNIRYSSPIAIIIITFFSLNAPSNAQMFKDIEVGAGLANLWIIGDNLAAKEIYPFTAVDATTQIFYGGGFMGVQPGFSLYASLPVDNDKNWIVPFGVDVLFMDGRERLNMSASINGVAIQGVGYIVNTQTIGSFFIGLNRNIWSIPHTGAQLYVGFDLRANIVSKDHLTQTIVDTANVSHLFEDGYGKSVALRMGGNLKIGIHGNFVNNFVIHPYFTIGILNLLGRNDSRGELLTPQRISFANDALHENESFVSTIGFCFLIQYKL